MSSNLGRVFRCSECQHEENSESELRAHVSTKHCGYLPFRCFLCVTSLPPRNSFEPTEEKMKEHLWSFHQTKELKYLCEIEESKRDQLDDIMRQCLDRNASCSRSSSHAPSMPPQTSTSTTPSSVNVDSTLSQSSPVIDVSDSNEKPENRCKLCYNEMGIDNETFSPGPARREHVLEHFQAKYPLTTVDNLASLNKENRIKFFNLFESCFSPEDVPELKIDPVNVDYKSPTSLRTLESELIQLSKQNESPPLPKIWKDPSDVRKVKVAVAAKLKKNSLKNLQQHKIIAVKNQGGPCRCPLSMCNKEFDRWESLRAHMSCCTRKLVSEKDTSCGSTMKCSECKVEVSQLKIDEHIALAHQNDCFVFCPKNNCEFEQKWSVADIQKHIETVHNDNSKPLDHREILKPKLKELKQKLFPGLNKESKVVKGKKIPSKWKCCKCEKSLSFQGYLARHLKKIHNCGYCLKCKKVFDSIQEAKKHSQACTETYSVESIIQQTSVTGGFSCEHCGKWFQFLCRLKRHQGSDGQKCLLKAKDSSTIQLDTSFSSVFDSQSSVERQPVKCGICGKEFKNTSGLGSHMSHRHPEQQQQPTGHHCICGTYRNRLHDFKHHQKTCEIYRNDKKKRTMATAELQESSEDVVDLGRSSPISVTTREWFFTEEHSISSPSSNVCHKCYRVFRNETVKLDHEEFCQLDGSKSEFVCNRCPRKSFLNSTSLKEHIDSVHYGKPQSGSYKCQFCSQTFDNSNDFIHHKATIHEKPKAKSRTRKDHRVSNTVRSVVQEKQVVATAAAADDDIQTIWERFSNENVSQTSDAQFSAIKQEPMDEHVVSDGPPTPSCHADQESINFNSNEKQSISDSPVEQPLNVDVVEKETIISDHTVQQQSINVDLIDEERISNDHATQQPINEDLGEDVEEELIIIEHIVQQPITVDLVEEEPIEIDNTAQQPIAMDLLEQPIIVDHTVQLYAPITADISGETIIDNILVPQPITVDVVEEEPIIIDQIVQQPITTDIAEEPIFNDDEVRQPITTDIDEDPIGIDHEFKQPTTTEIIEETAIVEQSIIDHQQTIAADTVEEKIIMDHALQQPISINVIQQEMQLASDSSTIQQLVSELTDKTTKKENELIIFPNDCTLTVPQMTARGGGIYKCSECGREVSKHQLQGRTLHIYQHHVQHPIYQCLYCSFSSNVWPEIVGKHIRTVHDGQIIAVIDNRDKFQDEIGCWLARSFAGQQ